MDISGKIFNIQRFCTSDGPGIRTTVFFKGCPLRCKWCHNPESQSIENELMYDRSRCVSCMRCVLLCQSGCHKIEESVHKLDITECSACGKCTASRCGALEIAGKEMTAKSVIDEVMKDKLYFDNSGGGITLSGGEPLFQEKFCMQILKLAKGNGVHVCIETCGFAKSSVIEETAKYTDIYLFDLKQTDSEKHKEFTGVDNKKIIENLFLLDSMSKKIILRCPIIPQYNDTEEHLTSVAEIANKLENIIAVEIEPYHNFGEIKYDKLSRLYEAKDVQIMDGEKINELVLKLDRMCDVTVRKAD